MNYNIVIHPWKLKIMIISFKIFILIYMSKIKKNYTLIDLVKDMFINEYIILVSWLTLFIFKYLTYRIIKVK